MITRFFVFLRLIVVFFFDGITNPWVLSYCLLFISKLFRRDESCRVIVTGSLEFNDYKKLSTVLDKFLSDKTNPEIVSGTSRGVELLAERYGTARGIPVKRFPPRWNTNGRSAGYKRYNNMLAYADKCVVVGDTSWKMTRYVVHWARRLFIRVEFLN